jgi:hypothetical protein
MMENKAGRDLQVPQRMTRLSETIACLDKAAEELIVRLAPVSKSTEPMPSDTRGEDVPKEYLVDHAKAIEEAASRISSIVCRIQSITARLEL